MELETSVVANSSQLISESLCLVIIYGDNKINTATSWTKKFDSFLLSSGEADRIIINLQNSYEKLSDMHKDSDVYIIKYNYGKKSS